MFISCIFLLLKGIEVVRKNISFRPLPQGGKCVLPQYPKHGAYVVVGNPNAKPGQTYPSVFINVTCNPGFGVENHRDSLYCFDGIWSEEMPKCVREYFFLLSFPNKLDRLIRIFLFLYHIWNLKCIHTLLSL